MSGAHANDGRHDFDFLHGSWRIHNRRLAERLAGSDEWLEFPSRAEVRPILHGLGNVDTISIDDLPGVGRFEGMTVRLFDPEERTWSIHWASTAAPGRLDLPLTGRFTDGVGVFHGEDVLDGQPIRVRFEWTSDGADHARWPQAFSANEGRTWELNWVMDFSRTRGLVLDPIVDSNVHLWDQRANPVFWVTDRALAGYRRETDAFEVSGIVWSDAGAADPMAAAK